MKRLFPCLAFALTLLASASSRADETPPSWTYKWTPGESTVDGAPAFSGGANFITLLEPKGGTGSSVIVAANISLFGSAATSTFDAEHGFYSLSVEITDSVSSESNVFTFEGKLSNSFSTGHSVVTNDILDTEANPQTQSAVLGGHTYTVTIPDDFYSPPGPANSGGLGAISAFVTVTPGEGGDDDGGGGVAETPEPTALMLSLFGLSAAGAASWRKRRRAV